MAITVTPCWLCAFEVVGISTATSELFSLVVGSAPAGQTEEHVLNAPQ